MAEAANRKLGEKESKMVLSEAEEEEEDSVGDVMYEDFRPLPVRLRKEYYRQLKESECFDLNLDLELGVPIMGPIVPQRGNSNHQYFVELSEKAISTFNSQNGTNYKFLKNVSVNTSAAAGMWCYITFEAKDPTIGDSKIFRTVAWWGIDGARDIEFCKIKDNEGGGNREIHDISTAPYTSCWKSEPVGEKSLSSLVASRKPKEIHV